MRDCVELRSRSNGVWMEATGCATEGATCTCAPVPNRRGVPQVLPAYGLQDLRNEHRNPKTKANPNTMCLQSTLGGDLGSGHFYLAKNRTFLLCVDTKRDTKREKPPVWFRRTDGRIRLFDEYDQNKPKTVLCATILDLWLPLVRELPILCLRVFWIRGSRRRWR